MQKAFENLYKPIDIVMKIVYIIITGNKEKEGNETMEKDMKQVTVYNNKGEKVVVKVGEKWMNGSNGVVTIDRITRKGNKKHATYLYYTQMNGKKWCAQATWMGGNDYGIISNMLFRIA